MLSQFQAEFLVYMVGQLCDRTSGSLVERAWAVLEEHYQFHQELMTLSSKTHLALAVLVVRAWKVREDLLQKTTGSVPPTPAYIARLRAILPSTEARQSRVDEGVDVSPNVTPNVGSLISRTAPSGLSMPWDQMLRFVDAGTLDWDMFAAGGDNTAAAAAGTTGNYGMGFMGHQGNSWM